MSKFMAGIGMAVALICAGSVSAETLVNWNNDGLSRTGGAASKAAPKFVGPFVQSSDLTFGKSLQATAWPDSLTVYANQLKGDLKGAVDSDHYYSFTVTPKDGKTISYAGIFSRVAVNCGNLAAGASIKFVLLSSVTGFIDGNELASFTANHPTDNSGATTTTGTFDLSTVAALQNVGDPVEFRIYAVKADGVPNRMGIGHIFYQDGQDDLRVEGTVQ